MTQLRIDQCLQYAPVGMEAMSNATEAKIACRSLKIHLGPNLGNAAGSDVATGGVKSRRCSDDGNPLNNVNT
jgi:hypothetical protein